MSEKLSSKVEEQSEKSDGITRIGEFVIKHPVITTGTFVGLVLVTELLS